MPCLGRSQYGLGGNATEIEAVPPHQVPLDERDACAETGSAGGADETRRPGAEYYQIVAVGWERFE